jgi:putative endonuclease
LFMFYVYLLKNEYRELYYGCTKNLKKRFFEHNNSKVFSTRGHEWRLVYYEAYFSEDDAWEREKQLKQYGQALGQLKRRVKKSLSES